MCHPPPPETRHPREPVSRPTGAGTTDGNDAANTVIARNVDGSNVERRPAKSTSARQKR